LRGFFFSELVEVLFKPPVESSLATKEGEKRKAESFCRTAFCTCPKAANSNNSISHRGAFKVL